MPARSNRVSGLVLGLLIAAATPAAAQTAGAPQTSAKDPASAAVTITKADCSQLVEHAPAPDVAYQPGVDVTGNSVAPVDLNGGYQLELPETIVIDIEVDLLDRFGIPANPVLYDANAVIGRVEYRDGRATFNGQPLQDEAQAELSRRCQEILRAQQ